MPEVRMTAKEAIMKCEKIINKRFGKDE